MVFIKGNYEILGCQSRGGSGQSQFAVAVFNLNWQSQLTVSVFSIQLVNP